MSRTAAQLQRAAVLQFVHALVTATMYRRLFDRSSPFVLEGLREMVQALQTAAACGADMPLRLQLTDDCIHHDGKPLRGPSLQAAALLQACAERQIAQLAFATALTIDEANRCFDLLLLPQNLDALRRDQRDQALLALGIRHVQFGLRTAGDPADRRQELADASALHRYQDLAATLQQSHALAHRDEKVAVDAVQTAIEKSLPQFDEPSALLALATQDDVDRFTVGHSVRVALLALQVARALGASRDQLVRVGSAALMHDIGKSKVPQEILWKRGRLDAEEWRWMAQHPRLGAQILIEQQDEVDPSAIGAAFCHHLGQHGTGYPKSSLPIVPSGTSRLVRVCDVFEALTSVRPYKRALAPIEAYAVMFRNADDFDAAWLRCFARTLGIFPNGTRVLLDDGAEALVLRQGRTPHEPEVQLLSGPGGHALPPGAPERITIGPQPDGRHRRIATVNTQDRCILVPKFADADPEYLTVDPSHACLSAHLAGDAHRVARCGAVAADPQCSQPGGGSGASS